MRHGPPPDGARQEELGVREWSHGSSEKRKLVFCGFVHCCALLCTFVHCCALQPLFLSMRPPEALQVESADFSGNSDSLEQLDRCLAEVPKARKRGILYCRVKEGGFLQKHLARNKE